MPLFSQHYFIKYIFAWSVYFINMLILEDIICNTAVITLPISSSEAHSVRHNVKYGST